jgi:hypothetical protein
MKTTALDASTNLAPYVTELKAHGITTIGRYYSTRQWKVVTRKEAEILSGAGFDLFTIFENSDDPSEFNSDSGTFAAQYAINSARAIGQPIGSTIYFAVDFNSDESQVRAAVVPYFLAIRKVMTGSGAPYKIGVYGNGLACSLLEAAGLCEFTWLSGSSSYYGTQDFYQSGKWSIAQHPSESYGKFDADPDEVKADIGQFRLGAQVESLLLSAPGEVAIAADNSANPWMVWMEQHIGEVQRTGAIPTPFTREIFSHTTYPLGNVTPESCAATVCAALEETGYRSTHNAAAASYLTYGDACDLKPGCIVVYTWPNGQHHVDFCDAIVDADRVRGLGGNQGGELQYSYYARKYISATRWPVKP